MENKDFGFIQNVKFVDVLLGQGFVGAMHTPKATRKDMAHQLTLRHVLPRVLPPSPPHPAPSLPSPRVLRRVSPRVPPPSPPQLCDFSALRLCMDDLAGSTVLVGLNASIVRGKLEHLLSMEKQMHTPKATRKDMAHQLTLRRVLPRVLPPSPPHPAPSLPSPAPSPRVLRRVSPRLTLHASGYPAGPAAIIRDISFRIQPEMTPFGYSILMLG